MLFSWQSAARTVTHKHVPVGSRVWGWRAKAATNERGWGGAQGPRLSGGCPCARQAGGGEPGAGAVTSCRVRQVQGRSGSFSPGGTIWAISRISSFISPSARPRGGTPGGADPLCPPNPQGTGIRHYPGITALSRETLTLYNRGSISPLLALSPPRSQSGAAARQREVAGVAAGGGAARRLRPRLGKGPDAVNLPAGGSGEGLRGPPRWRRSRQALRAAPAPGGSSPSDGKRRGHHASARCTGDTAQPVASDSGRGSAAPPGPRSGLHRLPPPPCREHRGKQKQAFNLLFLGWEGGAV